MHRPLPSLLSDVRFCSRGSIGPPSFSYFPCIFQRDFRHLEKRLNRRWRAQHRVVSAASLGSSTSRLGQIFSESKQHLTIANLELQICGNNKRIYLLALKCISPVSQKYFVVTRVAAWVSQFNPLASVPRPRQIRRMERMGSPDNRAMQAMGF